MLTLNKCTILQTKKLGIQADIILHKYLNWLLFVKTKTYPTRNVQGESSIFIVTPKIFDENNCTYKFSFIVYYI